MEEEQICELMDITAELKREVWERSILLEQKKDTELVMTTLQSYFR